MTGGPAPARVACARPGCGEQVSPGFLACRPHWRQLPAKLRHLIGAAWQDRCQGKPGATQRHIAAKRAAVAYWTGQ